MPALSDLRSPPQGTGATVLGVVRFPPTRQDVSTSPEFFGVWSAAGDRPQPFLTTQHRANFLFPLLVEQELLLQHVILYSLSVLCLKLYFIDHAVIVVLIFPHPVPPYSLRQSPQHCSCPWIMYVSSLATPFPLFYFISPWLFCNYLFVLLNLLTSSPILPLPPPIWQPSSN